MNIKNLFSKKKIKVSTPEVLDLPENPVAIKTIETQPIEPSVIEDTKSKPVNTSKEGTRIYIPAKKVNKVILISIVIILLTVIISSIYALVAPFDKEVYQIDFAGQTCISKLTLLPDLYKMSGDDVQIYLTDYSQFFGQYNLFAKQVCFAPKKLLNENSKFSSNLSFINDTLLKREVKFETVNYPTLTNERIENGQGINAKETLVFKLNREDNSFKYVISADNKSFECTKTKDSVQCPLIPLELKQGETYKVKLERFFSTDIIGSIFEKDLTTIPAVTIVESSIKIDETIFNSPTQIDLKLNKNISKISPATFYQNVNNVTSNFPFEMIYDKNLITIKLNATLARQNSYELVIPEIIAEDGGVLETEFKLKFATSGGPKSTGINISGVAIPTNTGIALTFDQPVNPNQDYSGAISLSSGTGFSKQVSGNTLTIQPNGNLPACSNITVNINNNVQNQYGIGGNSSKQYSFKTQCAQIASIGNSVNGRQILSYTFGSGSKKIVYVGSIHGNESNTKNTLTKWISELEANSGNIPQGSTLIIIPTLNPDGNASNSRYNAHGVDLNRNYNTTNWQQQTIAPDGVTIVPNGGGSAPASEPETQALVNLIQTQHPALVISYHSVAGYVISNDSGNASSLAMMYSQKTGYKYIDAANYPGSFEYPVTGALEAWTREAFTLPTLVVELSSASADQFDTNKSAMWELTK